MSTYRKTYDVVGFTYDASAHCVACTYERFPLNNFDNDLPTDSEGNDVHPLFLDQLTGNDYCDDCSQDLSY